MTYTTNLPAGKPVLPMEQLENGAPVRIGNKTGYVFRSELVQAHPCGMVAIHEIRLTKKVTRVSPRRYRIDPINETIKPTYASLLAI